jgi:flagellar hook-length control protein FliK
MNMPVLPVTSSSQPPAEATARATDAGQGQAASGSPTFSNVLSQQKPQGPAAQGTTTAAGSPRTAKDDTSHDDAHDPADPDATLTLILDSAALPLMQAPATPAAPLADGTQGQTAAAAQTATAALAAQAAAPLLTTPAAAELLATAAGTAATAKPDPALTDTPATPTPAGQPLAASVKIAASTPLPATLGADAHAAAPSGKDGSHTANPAATADDPRNALPATLTADTGNAPAPNTRPASHDAQAVAPVSLDAAAALTGAPLGGTSVFAPQAATATAPITTLAVPTPLGTAQWAQDLSRQIVSFAQSGANGVHTVQLNVNPPELGPVHITLQIGDGSTQAAFMSPHAHVRQALENALPNLEQQFAQAGLSLGQANVSDQQAGQQGSGQSAFSSGSRNESGTVFSLTATAPAGSVLPPIATTASQHPDALVDTFV